MDPSVGHLNGILAPVGGNLNSNFPKSQMSGGLPGGGMLKVRLDRYIIEGGWIGCEELYGLRRMLSAEEGNILQDLHNSYESRIQ